MTKINQIAMKTRDYFLPILDFFEGEQISHTYSMSKISKDTHINLQRFINDLYSERFDKHKTPTEKYLKYIEDNKLTSYMNKTRGIRFLILSVKLRIQMHLRFLLVVVQN